MFGPWVNLSHDILRANLEAQHVIELRLMKLSRGGQAAQTEARRMVTEKVKAGVEAAAALGTGKSPSAVVRRYRTLMRANAKRLARK